ncbi:MAG: ABC transporter permease [Clostridia bacterium]|nr:ABC transporter permease [Clostridia bacterium]
MKSFAKLVKNEIIKAFAQTSYKVLLIILAVSFVILPILQFALGSFADGFEVIFDGDVEDDIYDLEKNLESQDDEFDKAYISVRIECLKQLEKHDLSYSSWQYNTMYQDYEALCMAEKAFELLKENIVSFDDLRKTSFGYYLPMLDEEELDYSLLYNRYHKERLEYEKLFESSQVTDYYKQISKTLSNNIKEIEVALGQYKASNLLKNEYEYEILIYEKTLEAGKLSLNIFEELIERKLEYNGWEYNSAMISYQITSDLVGVKPPMSETEFDSTFSFLRPTDTYEEYIEEWKQDINDKVDAVYALEYSVKNDIPTQSAQSSSSKGQFISILTSNIQFIMYFLIVLAALIVSNEFSSGTSRLLFVRPHSRNKILLSKYATVAFFAVALNIVNLLITFIAVMITNGVGDLFAPMLTVENGIVSEIPQIFNTLAVVILANIRVAFIVTLTFMLASLSKKGALSIVVGIIADLVMSAIGAILIMLISSTGPKFTPFVYYDLEMFASSKLEYMLSTYYIGQISDITNVAYFALSEDLSVWAGIANLVFWIVVFAAATFIPFKKQEIKN